MLTNDSGNCRFCDWSGFADQPGGCEECTSSKIINLLAEDGTFQKVRVVYPEQPVFRDEDIHAIKLLLIAHYGACVYQDITCHGCEVYIEHFLNAEPVRYIPVS